MSNLEPRAQPPTRSKTPSESATVEELGAAQRANALKRLIHTHKRHKEWKDMQKMMLCSEKVATVVASHSDDVVPTLPMFCNFLKQQDLDALDVVTATTIEPKQAQHTIKLSLNGTYACGGCAFVSDSLTTFRWHQEAVKKSNARPFQCPRDGCNNAFKMFSLLKKHEISHSDAKPHFCRNKSCDKAFKRAGDRNRHERLVCTKTTPDDADH